MKRGSPLLEGEGTRRGHSIRHGIPPPTFNLDNPSVETAIDLVPREAKRVDIVLSNSFGFDGTNASLVMRRVD